MSKKHIKITVDEKIAERAKREAAREHLSMSAYVAKTVAEKLSTLSEDEDDFVEETVECKSYTSVYISDNDASTLRMKAKRVGLTDTAYVRQLIHTKDFKINNIVTEDIEEYIAEVHSAIESLNSIVGLIKRNGKGEVFKQDVVAIEEKADEISNILSAQVKKAYQKRKKKYDKAN